MQGGGVTVFRRMSAELASDAVARWATRSICVSTAAPVRAAIYRIHMNVCFCVIFQTHVSQESRLCSFYGHLCPLVFMLYFWSRLLRSCAVFTFPFTPEIGV